jgi:NTP pyrophosphatase (non-canonical NTP hydrolase)
VDTVEQLTAEVVAWADSRFPDRTSQSAFLKLFEEIGELIKNPRSPGEYADVVIMLLDLANMHGVQMTQAIRDKLAILHDRKEWAQTETGVFQHVGEDKPRTIWASIPGRCNRDLSNGTKCRNAAGAFCEACV